MKRSMNFMGNNLRGRHDLKVRSFGNNVHTTSLTDMGVFLSTAEFNKYVLISGREFMEENQNQYNTIVIKSKNVVIPCCLFRISG